LILIENQIRSKSVAVKSIWSVSLSIFTFYEFFHIFLGIYIITWVVYIPVSAFQKIHPLLVLLEMATPDPLGCASFVPTYSLYSTQSMFLSFNWTCKKCVAWLLSRFKLLESLLRPKYNTIFRLEPYSFPFQDFRLNQTHLPEWKRIQKEYCDLLDSHACSVIGNKDLKKPFASSSN
jgi:hypothetical protein